MVDAPVLIDGFLRALCAIANGAYPEGGMSVTYHRGLGTPPDLPAESPSEDRLLALFFAEALGDFNATAPERQGHLVQELRRVVREATGSVLVAARVEGTELDAFRTLYLWWRTGAEFGSAALFWSLD